MMTVDNYTTFKNLTARKHYLTEILDWIEQVYAPNYFISIQPPTEIKSNDPWIIKRHSWWICKKLEKALLGRYWGKQFYPFVGFYEHGKGNELLHVHILLSCPDRTLENIEVAFATVCKDYQKTFKTICPPNINVKGIYALDGLMPYCTKQLGLGRLEHIPTQNVFISEEYFGHVSSKSKELLTEFERKTNLRNN